MSMTGGLLNRFRDLTIGRLVVRMVRVPTGGLAVTQLPPTVPARSTTSTITAPELLASILTSAPAAAISLTLPTANAVIQLITQTNGGFPLEAGDSFDFSVVNTSAVSGAVVTILTSTGWALVGNILVAPNETVASNSSAQFRVLRSATGLTLYRVG